MISIVLVQWPTSSRKKLEVGTMPATDQSPRHVWQKLTTYQRSFRSHADTSTSQKCGRSRVFTLSELFPFEWIIMVVANRFPRWRPRFHNCLKRTVSTVQTKADGEWKENTTYYLWLKSEKTPYTEPTLSLARKKELQPSFWRYYRPNLASPESLFPICMVKAEHDWGVSN